MGGLLEVPDWVDPKPDGRTGRSTLILLPRSLALLNALSLILAASVFFAGIEVQISAWVIPLAVAQLWWTLRLWRRVRVVPEARPSEARARD